MEPQLALAEAKVRAVQSQIGRANASAAFESTNYQRLAKLHAREPGAVTAEDVEAAAARDKMGKAEVVAMQAELGVASAEVARLKTMLDYLVVRAPLAGTVTQRFADPGAYIAAGEGGNPIVAIARLDKLRLVLDLPERLTPLVRTGAKVLYSFSALPGKSYEGTISRRTDTLSEETRTMRAELDIDNADRMLSPGMYASLQIPLDGLPGISVVPPSALRTIDGRVCVLAVENGVIQAHPVESLLDAGTEVVVSGALTPTMRIVVKGPATLAEGQQVEVTEGI
jgi:RND family efflux transporter MFP subunit